jgi:hypothetical protein
VKHAPHLSKQAKLVKLADKLYNLRDLIRDPVPGWCVLLSLSLSVVSMISILSGSKQPRVADVLYVVCIRSVQRVQGYFVWANAVVQSIRYVRPQLA